MIINLSRQTSFGSIWKQNKLDPHQRHKDERCSDNRHVGVGLRLVSDPQFGDKNTNNVEQKEQIDLGEPTVTRDEETSK
ncbi:hypothetical protein scyTo_0019880 [Scyliorhinus torazame]|uniref:Uncharacterized protein n=1 Tax=Scyliorhinus torazame TaxID=75743 RepID=A0A401PTA8_SCYTO|nr:hypothetical protein [Scyliorhinus torazame]